MPQASYILLSTNDPCQAGSSAELWHTSSCLSMCNWSTHTISCFFAGQLTSYCTYASLYLQLGLLHAWLQCIGSVQYSHTVGKTVQDYTLQTVLPLTRVTVCGLFDVLWVLTFLTEHLYCATAKSLAPRSWITRWPDGRTWIRSSSPPFKGSAAAMSTPSACQTTRGAGLAGGGLHGMATLNLERALIVLVPDTVHSPKAVDKVRTVRHS